MKLLTSTIVFFLVLFACGVEAAESKLTPEQIAIIEQALVKPESAATEKTSRSVVEAAVERVNQVNTSRLEENATNLGKAIVAFTAQIGVGLKEFISSPTGFIVILFGSMYYFGSSVIGFITGFCLIFLGIKLVNRLFSAEEEILDSETTKDGQTVKKYKTIRSLRMNRSYSVFDSGFTAGYIILMFIALIPGFLFIVHSVF